jgi:hypothetical protein
MEATEEMVLQQLVMEAMAGMEETVLMEETEGAVGMEVSALLTVAMGGTVAMVDRDEKKHFF